MVISQLLEFSMWIEDDGRVTESSCEAIAGGIETNNKKNLLLSGCNCSVQTRGQNQRVDHVRSAVDR